MILKVHILHENAALDRDANVVGTILRQYPDVVLMEVEVYKAGRVQTGREGDIPSVRWSEHGAQVDPNHAVTHLLLVDYKGWTVACAQAHRDAVSFCLVKGPDHLVSQST